MFRLHNIQILRESGFHGRIMRNSHNLNIAVPTLDGFQCVTVCLDAIPIKEWWLVYEYIPSCTPAEDDLISASARMTDNEDLTFSPPDFDR